VHTLKHKHHVHWPIIVGHPPGVFGCISDFMKTPKEKVLDIRK
jgi:hypothetical protein